MGCSCRTFHRESLSRPRITQADSKRRRSQRVERELPTCPSCYGQRRCRILTFLVFAACYDHIFLRAKLDSAGLFPAYMAGVAP